MPDDYYYRKQVIELFNCDEEFLATLEAEELIKPKVVGSSSETVFPLDQVERIRVINTLVRELGVNLPGVEVIMEMRHNMMRVQRQFDQILEVLLEELKRRNL